MNPDSLFVVFDAIMFGVGGYCLYSWFYMKTKRRIHDNRMTIPSDMALSSCRNPEGYIAYMNPRLLLFSIVCLIFGGLNLLTNVMPMPREVQFVCIVALFVNILWFAFVIKKSMTEFWPPKPENPL